MTEVTQRNVTSKDDGFLLELYKSTRQEILLSGWTVEQQQAFLQMQFEFQRRAYLSEFPDADHRIIMMDGKKIGRILINRSESEIRLVDISLMVEARNQGIGSRLILALLDEGKNVGLPVRLHVLQVNPAVKLYERLGFRKIAESSMYFEMERPPE